MKTTRITKSKAWYWRAYILTAALAWVLCIIPTFIAGLLKLPVIATKNAETTLTGSFTICLIACIYPLYKGLIKLVKSPSAPVVMWILFGVTFLLYKISQETLAAMVVIFLVAAVSNTLGSLLFLVAKTFKTKWMYYGQVGYIQEQQKE